MAIKYPENPQTPINVQMRKMGGLKLGHEQRGPHVSGYKGTWCSGKWDGIDEMLDD